MLRLEEPGFAPLTLTDNQPGDGNPAAGAVSYSGP
jgi:hypothetical protein